MDDDFLDSDDDALILAATQAELNLSGFPDSPRPTKRRRTDGPGAVTQRAIYNGVSSSSSPLDATNSQPEANQDGEDDYETVEAVDGKLEREAQEREQQENISGRASRHKVHIPKFHGGIQDEFCTQPPPGPTQPHIIRGPIWRKPTPLIPKSAEKPHLQRWGSCSVEKENDTPLPAPSGACRSTSNGNAIFDMAKELEGLPSDAFDSSSPAPLRQRLVAPLNGLRQTTLFGQDAAQVRQSQANKRFNYRRADHVEPPTHHKLDQEAMRTWVYPTNLGTIREYQYNIVHRSLYYNTLVALPTGLGKTFIAATVMLNWFRWTRDAQIVFAAPTRPLVAQQVEACFNIVGIPRSETTMLTGGISPALRAEEWQSKRVFFMTPQTLINDLKSGYCDPKRIVLLVVDEAHRATGSYAYVEVVKFIERFNKSFRILALTATPGSDIDAVQNVINGLHIARVEIRTEQSLDIRNYVHHRKVEKEVFNYSDEMEMFMGLFSNAVQPVLTILNGQNAYWSKDPLQLSAWGLLQAKKQYFGSDAGRHAAAGVKAMMQSIFALLSSLAHAMELLKYHGTLPFFRALQSFQAELLEGKSKSKYRRQVNDHKDFETMMMRLRRCHADPEFVGHPKLDRLQEVVMNHFMDSAEGTRIMIFAHYRDSAEDIARVLGRHKPMIKPHVFVGQAASKNSEGMNQKKQEEIVQKFKNGEFNTLIATSIGEEGLDIGEVDLIVCYDSKASPIRMLQRMGRTGRKRQGKIILFQMRGKEENDADKAKDSYERMQELIADGGHFDFHDDKSFRIVPKEILPEADKRIIDIPIENSQPGTQMPIPSKRRKVPKRPPKKFHMPDGVITGFTTAAGKSIGNGGSGRDGKPQANKGNKAHTIQETPFPMPEVEDVILNAEQARDWESRYLFAADDDDLVIAMPRLDAHPERQREPSQTKFVSHRPRSLALGRFYQPNFQAGDERAYNDYAELPAVEVVDTEGVLQEVCSPPRHAPAKQTAASRPKGFRRTRSEAMEVDEGDLSSPPKTSQAMALPTQGVWLGSEDTDADHIAADEELPDSELADFVVDDDAPLEVEDDAPTGTAESATSTLPKLSQIQRNSSARRSKQRRHISHVLEPPSDSDGDLPDVGTLLAGSNIAKASPREASSNDVSEGDLPPAKHKKRRLVVNDSSDED